MKGYDKVILLKYFAMVIVLNVDHDSSAQKFLLTIPVIPIICKKLKLGV